MCTFEFLYLDGHQAKYEHITSYTCPLKDNKGVSHTEEKDLLKLGCPVGTMVWLHAQNATFCVNSSNIREIKVLLE